MWLCDKNLINHTHSDLLNYNYNNGSLNNNNNINEEFCGLNLIQIGLYTLTLYIILLLFLYRKCCPSKKRTRRGLIKNNEPIPPRNLFEHHVAFWNLNLIITLALSTQLAENLILLLYSGATVEFYLGVASGAIGLVAVGAQAGFFHVTEKRREGLWIVLPVGFHLFNGILCGVKLIISFQGGLTWEDLKVGVEAVGAVCSLTVVPLLIPTFFQYLRKAKNLTEGVDVRNVKYLHEYSSLGSRVTFFWFTDLLYLGYKSPLEEHHLGNLPYNETTKFQFKRFNQVYQQQKGNLWRAMWGTLWSSMLVGGLFRLGADFAGFVAPLGIKTIVGYTEGNWSLPSGTTGLSIYQFMGNGYVMGLVVLLSSLLQSTFSQCSTFLVNSEGIHIKVALQALIYKKALRLGVGRAKEEEEESSLDNILSEDTNNLMMFFWMAHFIWAIPLKLAILMGLLYLQLGYSALIGAGICILIMIPLQFLIAKNMSSNSKQLMEKCDERLRGISEILQGIKLLKLHGWELLFANQITAVRHKELKNLDRDLLYRSIMTFMTHISSVLVTVVTFGLYPLIESDRLEPPKVFAGLALFNQLTVPLFIFPITVPVVIDALVSGRRVREFLLLPEADSLPKGEDDPEESATTTTTTTGGIPLGHLRSNNITDGSTDSVFLLENIAEEEEEVRDEALRVVSILGGSFTWEGEEALSAINLHIPKEKLTVVVGPTGSGKSSLVAALLGEMPRAAGEINWTKGIRIAYAAQTPWMLNASVRDNILFGKPFKGARYKRVVEACALQPDIDILPENDQTEIGDKGINLSGGQKQRIAIARALYSNANLVILDDPLSALDVEVAHHVLDIGIQKFLLKSGRTVLLVTHHLPVLHQAHHIVAMEKGQIRIQGTLKEIEKGDPALHTQWHDMITKKEAELQRQLETKTAKERWTLLKLVSKVGLQFKSKAKEIHEPFRSRKGTFSHYKNLSNDIFLPSDSCHTDEMMTPLLRRRAISRTSRDSRASGSSNKHAKIERMSSLQGEARTKSPNNAKEFLRLQSLPIDEDLPTIRHTSTTYEVNRVQNNESLFKRLFSSKKTISSTGSSNPELEKVKGLGSTVSGVSEGEFTEDDGDDAEESLLNREGSGEEREYGTVPLRIYLIYIGACGRLLSGGYLFFALGYEVIRVYTNFWLSEWSDRVAQEGQNETEYEEIMSYYFKIYVILSLLTVAVSLVCNLMGKQAGANSRELLHAKMMDRLIRCPVGFFDSTPIGRIINRFSSDVAVVDRKLCISMQRFLQFVFLCLSAIVVNAIVNPWFLVVAVPVVAIYYYLQRFYRFSSRELQRIQAISRGPIYSHFHETLQGLSTIRSFRQEHRFTEQMLYKIDMNNRADMFINVGNRWLSISLDYLGSVIVFLATLASMLSAELYPNVVTPSIVGLAINYTLLVPVYLNWVVKFLAEVEMFMNSVDRIDRYSELEIEDYEGDPSVLTPEWPANGQVDFQNVSVQYGPDRPPIISQLKLLIPPKQKVGICGRSGSGKSSLLMSLFRISDVSSGRILIDGVDIQKIPLLTLRSRLSIIPQENILFSGSLRFNLDPQGKVSDSEIWKALELAQMKQTVQDTPGQLDSEMREGGGGFSAGQKQLLALARAILHKSKVVIMDEATSSVDLATEHILLQVVKEAFKESTVLTIAHRLETIADGDRVVVLERGSLLEDDHPAKLMRRPRSHFATMIQTSQQQSRLPT